MKAAAPFCIMAALAAGCGGQVADTDPAPTSPPASAAASPDSAEPPSAAGDSDAFLRALRDAGLPIDSDEYAIAVADGTCDMRREGLPDSAADELVQNSEPDFSQEQVAFFISTAVQHFCAETG